jgi:3-dehydroquinate synthase
VVGDDGVASDPVPNLRRIVLIGFSATGKSAVANALAVRLGRRAIDTDALIESASGRLVPDIFMEDGEYTFRVLENEACHRAAGERGVVVATGGGAWLDPSNRVALAEGGFVVCLEARSDTILARHAEAEAGRTDARPMIAGGDPALKAPALKAERQPYYAMADATIHTDELSVDDVVEEIVHAVVLSAERVVASKARLHAMQEGPPEPVDDNDAEPEDDFGPDVACIVEFGDGTSRRYPVYCGWGLLERMPDILERADVRGRLFLVYDTTLDELYARPVVAALRDAGREVVVRAVPSGEQNKNLEQLAKLYEWLAAERAERGDAIVALGGGVTTDLAGAAAATYLRGMPLVHVPTTLLGMSDASIGGKVAVDLPAGKNLVGAFYQPRAVIADVATLVTLPERELRAGFAEVIKHAFIRDAQMLVDLERLADSLPFVRDRGDAAMRERAVDLVSRNMALKAAVVSADEREADLRTFLNYGHTIGHAIEQVSGYGRYLHGEGVAIGLVGAAMIGERLGLIDTALVDRHRALLEAFGLPVRVDADAGLAVEDVLQAMLSDKKVVGGKPRWVLLQQVGEPVVRDDVPTELVRDVVAELVAGD